MSPSRALASCVTRAKTGLAQLQLRDADHVLHAHAHGEVAGELADEGAVGARPAGEAVHAREIALGVARVLVVGEAFDAFGDDGAGFGWERGRGSDALAHHVRLTRLSSCRGTLQR